MVTLIALIASLFAGASAGIIGVASVAIRREERDFTLTSEPTGNMIRAGRKLNGVYVRCPHSRRHPPVMTPAYRSLVRLRDDQDFYAARQRPAMERWWWRRLFGDWSTSDRTGV